jgi:hypothetical protein
MCGVEPTPKSPDVVSRGLRLLAGEFDLELVKYLRVDNGQWAAVHRN